MLTSVVGPLPVCSNMIVSVSCEVSSPVAYCSALLLGELLAAVRADDQPVRALRGGLAVGGQRRGAAQRRVDVDGEPDAAARPGPRACCGCACPSGAGAADLPPRRDGGVAGRPGAPDAGGRPGRTAGSPSPAGDAGAAAAGAGSPGAATTGRASAGPATAGGGAAVGPSPAPPPRRGGGPGGGPPRPRSSFIPSPFPSRDGSVHSARSSPYIRTCEPAVRFRRGGDRSPGGAQEESSGSPSNSPSSSE